MLKKALTIALLGGIFVAGCGVSFGYGYLYGVHWLADELKKDYE